MSAHAFTNSIHYKNSAKCIEFLQSKSVDTLGMTDPKIPAWAFHKCFFQSADIKRMDKATRLANDTLTILNLACFKHTGYLLPTSNLCENNWKFFGTIGTETPAKEGVWSPHPYFNPLHLYYPSDDFGVRVLRSILVDEIKYCRNPSDIPQKQEIKKLYNPYGYQGVKVKVECDHNSRPAKIKRKFLEDATERVQNHPHTGLTYQYPYFIYYGDGKDHLRRVRNHPRTEALDEKIMRRKLCNDGSFSAMSYKYDIWTAKGLLRRKKETAEIIYNLIYLKIGMSYAGDRYYFKGYHCGWNEILRNIRGIPGPGGAPPWTFARKTYLQCIKPMIDREPKLEPKDWIRIFAPNQINKTEKINRVLIANFPPS